MAKRMVDFGKHIDVHDFINGTDEVIEDYIDIKLVDDVAFRVCLVRDYDSKQHSLKLDRQLVIAFDKRENESISSYDVTHFYGSSNDGQCVQVVGSGNLVKHIFEVCRILEDTQVNVNEVMLLIKKKAVITV